MNLPEDIKILHKIFSLRERSPNEFVSDHRLAEVNFLTSEISYLKLSGSEVVDSLVHEMLHGVFHMMNLNHGMSEDVEEHLVTALATGLTTIMADNPELFPALQELIEDD